MALYRGKNAHRADPRSPDNKRKNGDPKKSMASRGKPRVNSQFADTPAAYATGHGAKPQRRPRAGEPSEGMNWSAQHCQNAADYHRYGVGGGDAQIFKVRGYS